MLSLHIDFPNVFTENAYGQDLYASEETENAQHGGPAGDRIPGARRNNRPQNEADAHQKREDPQHRDDSQRADGKAGDAVQGQCQHFPERILALPRQTLLSLIENGSALKPD